MVLPAFSEYHGSRIALKSTESDGMYWYILLTVAFAILLGYTMRFQGATLYWGKALSPSNPLLPNGMQDEIWSNLVDGIMIRRRLF